MTFYSEKTITRERNGSFLLIPSVFSLSVLCADLPTIKDWVIMINIYERIRNIASLHLAFLTFMVR